MIYVYETEVSEGKIKRTACPFCGKTSELHWKRKKSGEMVPIIVSGCEHLFYAESDYGQEAGPWQECRIKRGRR